MEHLKDAIDALKYVNAAFVAASVISVAVLWLAGIGPALWRLGNGLARRKIVIFANNDMLASLTNLLCDSGLFRRSNLSGITTTGDIGRCEAATLFLVYWPDWRDNIDDILHRKPDSAALVVYAPREHGPVPDDVLNRLNEHRNVILTNFRGRLLNDLVTSMITTSYEKK